LGFLEEAGLSGHLDFFEAVCKRSLCFEARAGSPRTLARKGASRLVGNPDLPQAIDWPVRAAYPNGKVLAGKLARRGPELADAFQVPMPLDFVCQLDLEEVAKTKVLGDLLPDHGRLLIFWDSNCGPYIDSAQSCRVIWDRSPINALKTRAAPDPAPELQSYPAKPISFLPVWSIPDRLLLRELSEDEDLSAMLDDEDYEEVWGEIIDRGASVLASGREVLAHRLLGWPIPEQWDPRFTAVAAARGVASLFEREPTEAERSDCVREMHEWTMLLQIGLSELGEEYSEGTVYFVMRQADLKECNFDRVHAIYQQT